MFLGMKLINENESQLHGPINKSRTHTNFYKGSSKRARSGRMGNELGTVVATHLTRSKTSQAGRGTYPELRRAKTEKLSIPRSVPPRESADIAKRWRGK
ncbi:MAG: hypothetical protein Kow0040_09530 [Thermogutta sp.]